jgi:hypothetical protein
MNDKERLELICWLIERNDALRASIANRAAIVISTDALLLAGVTFLLDKTLSGQIQYEIEKIVLSVSIGATVILLALSIVYATTGIASIWKLSRKIVKDKEHLPKRDFFHAIETVETHEKFKPFAEKFEASDTKQMIERALSCLWSVETLYHRRYQSLRKAVKLLLFSIIPFVVSVVVLLNRFFPW